jgi:hypothetical protein
MATWKQIEANRLNAQKSTGPRTENGKARSSQNALKSGIYTKTILIPGENGDEFEALLIEYHDHYLPQSPAERDLVDQLIRDTWQLRRFAKAEVQMWEHELASNQRTSYFDQKSPIGQAFLNLDERLARLHRMIAVTKRSFKDALRELERLQAARGEAEPESTYSDPDPPTLAAAEQPAPLTPIGFVPSAHCAAKKRAEARTDPQSLVPSPQSLALAPAL